MGRDVAGAIRLLLCKHFSTARVERTLAARCAGDSRADGAVGILSIDRITTGNFITCRWRVPAAVDAADRIRQVAVVEIVGVAREGVRAAWQRQPRYATVAVVRKGLRYKWIFAGGVASCKRVCLRKFAPCVSIAPREGSGAGAARQIPERSLVTSAHRRDDSYM